MLPQKGKGSSGNLQNELTWLWEIHLKSKMGEGSWPFHKSLNTILLCKQVSQTAHHGQKCILLVKICTKLDWKNVHNSRKLFCQLRPSPHPHKFSSKMLLNGPFYPSHIPLRKTNYILVQICTKGRSPGPNLINFRKTSKRPLTPPSPPIFGNLVAFFFQEARKLATKFIRIGVTPPPFPKIHRFYPPKITEKTATEFFGSEMTPEVYKIYDESFSDTKMYTGNQQS